MPTWNEYKAVAKDRGALAFELYVAQSTPVAEPDQLKAVLPDHLAYQGKLESEGKLFLAGPMSDDTGEMMQGVGLIVYRASSLEEAMELASNDPMHAKGIREFSLRRWLINEGSLSINLGLSTKAISLD